MGGPAKPYHQVKGKPVDGAWKSDKGFYVRNPNKQGADQREFFASLDAAISLLPKLHGLERMQTDSAPRSLRLIAGRTRLRRGCLARWEANPPRIDPAAPPRIRTLRVPLVRSNLL